MGAQLHILGGDRLFVDESAKEAARQLEGDGWAQLHSSKKPVLVNPAAIAYIDEAGTPQVHT